MRRLRDLISGHISDLGGDDAISEAERSIVRRASMLELQLEMMETRWAVNEGVASASDLQNYQRVASTIRRLLEAVGLKRRAKDITPDPLDYAKRYSRQAADAEVEA